jgi:hypothetical protein
MFNRIFTSMFNKGIPVPFAVNLVGVYNVIIQDFRNLLPDLSMANDGLIKDVVEMSMVEMKCLLCVLVLLKKYELEDMSKYIQKLKYFFEYLIMQEFLYKVYLPQNEDKRRVFSSYVFERIRGDREDMIDEVLSIHDAVVMFEISYSRQDPYNKRFYEIFELVHSMRIKEKLPFRVVWKWVSVGIFGTHKKILNTDIGHIEDIMSIFEGVTEGVCLKIREGGNVF